MIDQQRLPLFVTAFAVFVLVSPVVLWSSGLLTAETYFVACFLWFLVSSEVFAPADPETAWWKRLRWIKAVGWLVLAYVVYQRVVAVF